MQGARDGTPDDDRPDNSGTVVDSDGKLSALRADMVPVVLIHEFHGFGDTKRL